MKPLCTAIASFSLALAHAAAAAPGPAGCDTGSWIGGSTEYCNGVFVYHDYVYDDYGATAGDPNAGSTGTLSRTDGNVRYTADINSADLVALRLWVVGGQLHVSFELNTLRDPSSTVAALAIDTDNNAATGASLATGAWQDLCAVEQPYGTGVCGVPLRSTGWEEVHLFETGDPATNRIEGEIPLPPGTTWRVQAVTAIKSRRVVMNVAFRGGIEDQLPTNDQTGLWFEERQATALTTGDVSQFGGVVEVSKLLGGVSEPAPVAAGYHERIYTSDFTIAEVGGEIRYDQDAEGMDFEGIPAGAAAFARAFHFYGKNQPFGIYIPQDPGNLGTVHGMQLVLHGYSANHASLVNNPGMQQNVGEARNRVLVVPLGRGPAGWYNEISEKDVLDVMTDVEANYPIDPEKEFAGGYSMGGYGTYRFATLYPDRFAGFIAWVGALSGGGNKGISTLDFFGNLRQVPGAMLYSGEDELVNITSYLDIQARTAELGYEGILYFHPAGEHLTYAVADDWVKESNWSAGRVRQRQPKQVTYRTYPFVWNESLGVIHDRAYWVSQIRGRSTGSGDYVDVDITTSACGGSLPTMTRTAPDPTGTDPIPWTAQEFLVTGQQPIAQQSRIDATLANVASLQIDTNDFTGACVAGDQLAYTITTDGPVQVSFSDGSALDFASAGTYTGTLPEPGAAASFAAGAALLAGIARRRR
jgi:dienelactone hydrolase